MIQPPLLIQLEDETGERLLLERSQGQVQPDHLSLVQQGRQVPDKQIPCELSGTLRRSQPLIRSFESTPDIGVGVAYADLFKGVYEEPHQPVLNVAIKCIRPIDRFLQRRLTMVSNTSGMIGVSSGCSLHRSQRIKRETFIWMSVAHPNILQLVGYQVVKGTLCLVSPFCSNGSLSGYIAHNQEIMDSQKLKLVCPVKYVIFHLG